MSVRADYFGKKTSHSCQRVDPGEKSIILLQDFPEFELPIDMCWFSKEIQNTNHLSIFQATHTQETQRKAWRGRQVRDIPLLDKNHHIFVDCIW